MLPVIVLAGGLATRIRPVTEKIPKSLIEINGKPFVLHQLELLKGKGINKIHFCLGYLGEMVEEIVKESYFYNIIEITFSYDGEKLLGTGGAINNIIDSLPNIFFVTYGDSYLDINYKNIVDFYNKKLASDANFALMTIYRNEGQWDTSNVIFENGEIELYSKKIKRDTMKYIDFGLGILSKKHFEDYEKGQNFDLSEIYEKLSNQQKLLGYEVFNRFYEIGSFGGINELSNLLKTQ